jgi:hypothetical protein
LADAGKGTSGALPSCEAMPRGAAGTLLLYIILHFREGNFNPIFGNVENLAILPNESCPDALNK